ncbi:hypothetical protein [Streptomyces parvus]|uniref:hypothetical protein n=1 Tax=Streptomyces parvus TaxID=66428 RepID=UPI00292A4486|nr:hypothetical protein [Streptomyces parvus]
MSRWPGWPASDFPPEPGLEQLVDEVLDRLDADHAEDDVAVLAARVQTRPAP